MIFLNTALAASPSNYKPIQEPDFVLPALIAKYSFEEADGNLIDSINGYDGIIGGTIQREVAGKVGKAYTYNGSDSVIDLTELNDKIGTNSFSVGLWYKTTQVTQNRMIQNRGTGALGVVKGFTIGEFNGHVLIDDGLGNYLQYASRDWNLNNNEWQFAALTWNTLLGRMRVYRNKDLMFEGVNENMIGADLNGLGWRMGAANQNTQYYSGSMDEVPISLTEWTAQDMNDYIDSI